MDNQTRLPPTTSPFLQIESLPTSPEPEPDQSLHPSGSPHVTSSVYTTPDQSPDPSNVSFSFTNINDPELLVKSPDDPLDDNEVHDDNSDNVEAVTKADDSRWQCPSGHSNTVQSESNSGQSYIRQPETRQTSETELRQETTTHSSECERGEDGIRVTGSDVYLDEEDVYKGLDKPDHFDSLRRINSLLKMFETETCETAQSKVLY